MSDLEKMLEQYAESAADAMMPLDAEVEEHHFSEKFQERFQSLIRNSVDVNVTKDGMETVKNTVEDVANHALEQVSDETTEYADSVYTRDIRKQFKESRESQFSQHMKMRRKYKKIRPAVKVAAACIACVLIGMAIHTPGNASLYERLFSFGYFIQYEDSGEGLLESEVGYLPDGVELMADETEDEGALYRLRQFGTDGEVTLILMQIKDAAEESEVTAEGSIEEITVDGITYYMAFENGNYGVMWVVQDNVFHLSGDYGKDELLQIAENITVEKN